MNLTALISATRTRLGIPDTDAFFSDAVLTDLINSSLQYLSGQHDWPWLELTEQLSTTASVEFVTAITSSQRTIALFDATGIQLTYQPYHELVRFPADAKSNTLRFFGMRGKNIVLRPCPLGTVANALTHVYRAAEPTLLTGSDTPLMDVQFHPAIADMAACMGYGRQGNLTEAKN